MIICSQCGERNAAGEQFCGSCGAFLEWEGAAVDPGPPAAPPQPGYGQPPAVPPQPPAGRPAVYGQPAGYGAPQGGPPPGYAPAGYAPPPAVYGQPPGGYGQPPGGYPPAVTPPPGQPGAVLPGEVQKRRHVPPPEAPVVNPGDIVCRTCGTGNEDSRRFCRMCGNPLAGSPVAGSYSAAPPKIGWWRRRFGRTRDSSVHLAGDRPMRRPPRRWIKWVASLVVLAGAAVVVVGPGKTWIAQLKSTISGKVSKPQPFIPDSFQASDSAGGHGPAQAGDGVANKFWAPPAGRGTNEWLEAHFPHPFTLTSVIITPGVSDDQAKFLAQARPQAIDVTVTTTSGAVTTKTITLTDRAGPQTFSVSAPGALRVRLTIRSVYGQQSGHFVGIAEVEFFGRS